MKPRDNWLYYLEKARDDYKLRPNVSTWRQFRIVMDWSLNTLPTCYNSSIVIDWSENMARNKDWTFSPLKLTRSDVDKLEIFVEAHEHDLQMIFDIFADDHLKFSASYVTDKDSWVVTLTPKEDNSFNSRISMTSWAATVQEALWIAAYKHIEICDRKAWPKEDTSANWG